MAVYQWNVEDLNAAIRRLNDEKNELANELKFVRQNRAKATAAFEGEAARQFDANLQADIQNIQTVIDQLNREVDALRKVSTDCFLQCEQDLHNLVEQVGVV